MLKACANLSFFIWTHELLPLDILLLALIDRDDDPHSLQIVVGLICYVLFYAILWIIFTLLLSSENNEDIYLFFPQYIMEF